MSCRTRARLAAFIVPLWLLWLHWAPTARADLVEPAGELWIATSPAVCPGAQGQLFDHERAVRAQVDAAMKQRARRPRMFTTRAALLEALDDPRLHGWLFLFLSGHGTSQGTSRVCIGDGRGPGEWLDIDRDLLPALPRSLSGAVIVLDACSSAHVDPRRARIPTTVLSASPYAVDAGALFGAVVLASLSAAADENCNGIFDDDDLFSGLTHRLRAAHSLVVLEAWPKLRRNAPSPVPLPVQSETPDHCRALASAAETIAPDALPKAFRDQRSAQDGLARGQRALPGLDHDFFVLAAGADPEEAQRLRAVARRANLEELRGLTADQAAALARTTTFAEIYQLTPSFGWLQVWRLRDGLLMSDVRLGKAICGLPSRTVPSGAAAVIRDVRPRYSQAIRYLREVRDTPPGPATACFESEGQCFIGSPKPLLARECEP